ncbi:phospholipase D-like domain-containing protein [Colwellia sp. C1TZA3]|uniref:phospholipase D-like domain-containing protein n=1 Tax=Colwellia sp. C1TZA3 TaxID=2508879 RepID=UPI00174BF773|nr:phospholipase D-like domain-containing protein [Colwellia sp. C1TZA3]
MTSNELTASLEVEIPICQKLNIISAFVSKPAVIWLEKLVDNTSVCIVGRFSPKDFIDGASSIDAVRKCLLSGYVVKCLPNLHAKIYQIDDELIFTGSANMTGKGLALVNDGNLEACTKVTPSDNTKAFIQRIINVSLNITVAMLNKMQKIIDEFEKVDSVKVPDTWPEDIMPKIKDIFVSDFPLSKPGNNHELYEVNPSLEFAVIEANTSNFTYDQTLFKSSKAYCWLKKILIEHTGDRDLGFGQVSSLLHDALCDDPAPYRRDIKGIQSNLYEYLTLYAFDEVEVYVPGRRSQVLKYIKQ